MLAEMPVPLDEATCRACAEQDNPQAPNRVTCSRAIWALRNANRKIDSELMQCVQSPSYGAGTELESIIIRCRNYAKWFGLGWLLDKGQGCGCNALRNEMNLIGITKCRDNACKIADAITASYVGRFWLFRPFDFALRMLVVYVIGVAIDRAELRLKGKGCVRTNRG